MNTTNFDNTNKMYQTRESEKGSATVIAVLVLGLLTVFVALAVSRTTSEAIVMANDSSEGRAYTAAQASLEMMTRNFNKVFDIKLSPSTTDLANIQNAAVPNFPDYNFQQSIIQTVAPQSVTLSDTDYAGLYALRDAWRLQTTATDSNSGVQVAMMREFYNNRVPIFQFGIFYDDDVELFNPPPFKFGGRVHSNRNLFITPNGNGIWFNSRITAVGEFVTNTRRNWDTVDSGNTLYIKNASGSYVTVTKSMGSVVSTTAGASNNVFTNGTLLPNIQNDSTMPPSAANSTWPTTKASLDNNVSTHVKPLKLPITTAYSDIIEIVRRGRQVGDLYNDGTGLKAVTTTTAENQDAAQEKFANKVGIRISLADSKAKLPGCAAGTSSTDLNPVGTQCGIRLDGAANGLGADPSPLTLGRGYTPKPMAGGYQATRLNGERIYVAGREAWIKVELVSINTTTGLPQTQDVTEDILSLGITEQAPKVIESGTTKFEITGYDHTSTGTDSRSIIKLQRFLMPGPSIPKSTSPFMSTYTWNGTTYNLVVRNSVATGVNIPPVTPSGCVGTCTSVNGFATPLPTPSPLPTNTEAAHLKLAKVNSAVATSTIVPFPIEMFDAREGVYYDNTSNLPTGGLVTVNGVVSVIDIDVANMKKFLNGNFDGLFPTNTIFAASNSNTGLRSTNVPNANGWVVYVSDRRGDYDFDGEYDMEDIYTSTNANNDASPLQAPEDVNRNGILDVDFTNEAVRYNAFVMPDYAAATDHKYYRRAVRLINGQSLPGTYDSTTPANTKGFTVSSENGIYVKGNYNATGVANYYSSDPTPSNEYLPQNTADHIPAAVVGDAITILSNAWNDSESFAFPFARSSRTASETTIRFGMIAGDTMSGQQGTPDQGNYSHLSGGVHNFKRFLETWSGTNLNYTGSLINLYNSRNNNGSFKCCNTVYAPPNRNWIFDSTFTNPYRLPPGTPFFQYVQMTGFMRLNG